MSYGYKSVGQLSIKCYGLRMGKTLLIYELKGLKSVLPIVTVWTEQVSLSFSN